MTLLQCRSWGLFLSVLMAMLSAELTVAEEPFTLGILIPLSGDLAEYGTAIRNGFELARQEQPESFSPFRFLYEDSRYDGKTAVAALQRMQSTQRVNLYYLWGVSPTEAMLPIAAQQKLPVLAETTVKEATVGKPLVVRAARTGERIAAALSGQILRQGAKSISLLVTEIPFYTDILKHLETRLKAAGVTIASRSSILPQESDFRSFLLHDTLRKADLVGVFLLPAQLITFYRQAEQAQLKLRTFNADLLDSTSIVEACPESINGAFFTQVGVSTEFRQLYQQAYGNDIQIGSAAQAYDVAYLVRDLFQDFRGQLSAEQVIARFTAMPPRSGATGSLRYSESVDSGKEIRMPVSLKIIRDGRIETLAEDSGF